MASKVLQSCRAKLAIDTGKQDSNGYSVYRKKSICAVRNDATPENVNALVQAVAAVLKLEDGEVTDDTWQTDTYEIR